MRRAERAQCESKDPEDVNCVITASGFLPKISQPKPLASPASMKTELSLPRFQKFLQSSAEVPTTQRLRRLAVKNVSKIVRVRLSLFGNERSAGPPV
jgi:hypothetical protein